MARRRRTKAQISFNMSRVRSTGSEIERVMEAALRQAKLYAQAHPDMFGRPDFVFPRARIAVFCDSHFWHGYRWAIKKKEIKKNRGFWLPKILSNMRRDRTVNRRLRAEGWTVLRFWEHRILNSTDRCVAKIKAAIDMRKVRI
jgi:DNA mismatch endonuclease Vsr